MYNIGFDESQHRWKNYRLLFSNKYNYGNFACPWCLNAFQKCKCSNSFSTSVKREAKKAEDKTKNLKGIRSMIRWMSVHKDVSRIANFSSLTVHKNCIAKTLIHVDTSRLMWHLLCIYLSIFAFLLLQIIFNLNSKTSSCKLIIIDVIICVLWIFVYF